MNEPVPITLESLIECVNVLDRVASEAPLTRRDHIAAQQSSSILKQYFEQVQKAQQDQQPQQG